MYKNLLGENLQEMVTLGYGMEMEKRGSERTEKKYKKAFDGMLAASNISEEEKQKMREAFKKLSSD